MFQESSGFTFRSRSYVMRSSCTDDTSAGSSSFGANVDNVIGGFDYIHIVFDDNHCISLFYEAVQHSKQYPDVFEMQTSCGFIKYIQRFSGIAFRKFCSQLDPLTFAT